MPQRTGTRVISNNPHWGDSFEIEYVEGPPSAVFARARDLVHAGWRFLAHPLYGNFNPRKNPYRTLLLQSSPDGCAVDMDSFEMLERALENLRTGREPPAMSQEMRNDFAVLDIELMRDALQRYVPKKNACHTKTSIPEGGKS